MADEKNIPVYVEDENAGKLQIGWATPEVDGVRTIQRFAIFESLELPNVIFGDVEAPKADAGDGPKEAQGEVAPSTAEVNEQPKPEDAQPVEGTTARRNK